MKVSSLLLPGALIMLLCASSVFAKVTLKNNTPFEIKVKVTFGPSGRSEGFPEGAISGDTVVNLEEGTGLKPGESYTRKKDALLAKRDWHVWAYMGNSWVKVLKKHLLVSGPFVKATVNMIFDKKTGENKFDVTAYAY